MVLLTIVAAQVYPQGRMSQIMDHLKIGDKLQFKGPRGDFSLDVNEKREIGTYPFAWMCREESLSTLTSSISEC